MSKENLHPKLKLCLGTVQFGVQYGIANKNGVPSDEELLRIFAIAKEAGVQCLDTARAYGNAEERIGQLSGQSFQIVSKFPTVSTEQELEEALVQTLKNLGTTSIYGYLAHNAANLMEHPALWKTLLNIKAAGKVEKIGFSLYNPEQVGVLLDKGCVPDLVQVPYSILDRKFEQEIAVLKKLGTEIHVRSVFLQGLYFMNPSELPKKLQALAPALSELHQHCAVQQVGVGQVALRYVYENPNIDQLVIGVDTAAQLQENIQLVSNTDSFAALFSAINAIQIPDKNLLNPANW